MHGYQGIILRLGVLLEVPTLVCLVLVTRAVRRTASRQQPCLGLFADLEQQVRVMQWAFDYFHAFDAEEIVYNFSEFP
jgi:hypothetical protein